MTPAGRAAISRPPTGPLPVHLALGAAQTGFALFPTLGKLALATMPPLPMAALRVTAAALLLELIRRFSTTETLAPGDRKRILLYGEPLIATAFAVVVLNERLTGRAVLAGFLILAGLAVSVARPRLPAEEVA